MKNNYNISVKLVCPNCRQSDFEFNNDKTKGTCNSCHREFPRGYDEIVELNSDRIEEEKEKLAKEVINDLKKDLNKSLKQTFRNSKYIKIK